MTARGTSRDGLFQWLTDGEVAVGEITANPLLVPCPACGAGIRQPCSKPSRHPAGRWKPGPHPSRIEAAGAATDQRTETA